MKKALPAIWGLLFVLIALGLILGGRILDARHMAAETAAVAEATPEPTPEPMPEPTPTPIPYVSPIEFEALWQQNDDVYAWLQIPGTTVDYPILQRAGDDEYYLNRNMDGSEGERAALARGFAAELTKRTGVETVMQDERLTSVEASEIMSLTGSKKTDPRDRIDAVAAAIILTDYLNRQRDK